MKKKAKNKNIENIQFCARMHFNNEQEQHQREEKNNGFSLSIMWSFQNYRMRREKQSIVLISGVKSLRANELHEWSFV